MNKIIYKKKNQRENMKFLSKRQSVDTQGRKDTQKNKMKRLLLEKLNINNQIQQERFNYNMQIIDVKLHFSDKFFIFLKLPKSLPILLFNEIVASYLKLHKKYSPSQNHVFSGISIKTPAIQTRHLDITNKIEKQKSQQEQSINKQLKHSEENLQLNLSSEMMALKSPQNIGIYQNRHKQIQLNNISFNMVRFIGRNQLIQFCSGGTFGCLKLKYRDNLRGMMGLVTFQTMMDSQQRLLGYRRGSEVLGVPWGRLQQNSGGDRQDNCRKGSISPHSQGKSNQFPSDKDQNHQFQFCVKYQLDRFDQGKQSNVNKSTARRIDSIFQEMRTPCPLNPLKGKDHQFPQHRWQQDSQAVTPAIRQEFVPNNIRNKNRSTYVQQMAQLNNKIQKKNIFQQKRNDFQGTQQQIKNCMTLQPVGEMTDAKQESQRNKDTKDQNGLLQGLARWLGFSEVEQWSVMRAIITEPTKPLPTPKQQNPQQQQTSNKLLTMPIRLKTTQQTSHLLVVSLDPNPRIQPQLQLLNRLIKQLLINSKLALSHELLEMYTMANKTNKQQRQTQQQQQQQQYLQSQQWGINDLGGQIGHSRGYCLFPNIVMIFNPLKFLGRMPLTQYLKLVLSGDIFIQRDNQCRSAQSQQHKSIPKIDVPKQPKDQQHTPIIKATLQKVFNQAKDLLKALADTQIRVEFKNQQIIHAPSNDKTRTNTKNKAQHKDTPQFKTINALQVILGTISKQGQLPRNQNKQNTKSTQNGLLMLFCYLPMTRVNRLAQSNSLSLDSFRLVERVIQYAQKLQRAKDQQQVQIKFKKKQYFKRHQPFCHQKLQQIKIDLRSTHSIRPGQAHKPKELLLSHAIQSLREQLLQFISLSFNSGSFAQWFRGQFVQSTHKPSQWNKCQQKDSQMQIVQYQQNAYICYLYNSSKAYFRDLCQKDNSLFIHGRKQSDSGDFGLGCVRSQLSDLVKFQKGQLEHFLAVILKSCSKNTFKMLDFYHRPKVYEFASNQDINIYQKQTTLKKKNKNIPISHNNSFYRDHYPDMNKFKACKSDILDYRKNNSMKKQSIHRNSHDKKTKRPKRGNESSMMKQNCIINMNKKQDTQHKQKAPLPKNKKMQPKKSKNLHK